MDFEAIYTQAMQKAHKSPTVDTDLLTMVKNWINVRYHEAWTRIINIDPTTGRGETRLITTAPYTIGTVTTDETTTITGDGTTFTSGMVGRKFKLDSYAEIYEIAAYVSATEITLDKAINDDADDELSYKIYQDEIDLPSDCGQIISIGQYLTANQLTGIGLRELRDKQLTYPVEVDSSGYADPAYWAYLDDSTIIVYPSPSRKICLLTDYTINITDLSAASDVPLLPPDFHRLLITGGVADIYEYDDDARAMQANSMFEYSLGRLVSRVAGDTDSPRLQPVIYRS